MSMAQVWLARNQVFALRRNVLSELGQEVQRVEDLQPLQVQLGPFQELTLREWSLVTGHGAVAGDSEQRTKDQ